MSEPLEAGELYGWHLGGDGKKPSNLDQRQAPRPASRRRRRNLPIDKPKVRRGYSFAVAKGDPPVSRTDVLQGTLDLMVLQTLDTLGPQHGYGIARRIEQVSEDTLRLNEGTVYASLMRLLQRRWISASWGTSENNRRARFYTITKTGRRQLTTETANWERIASVMARLLGRAGPA